MKPGGGSMDVLARYVPRLLLERLDTARDPRRGAPPRRLDVAALWIDISGFTPLTTRFAELGPRGAELVTDILNRTFGELIDRITAWGGDVIDFAGDGLLAVWPVEGKEALSSAVLHAACCADGIQREMGEFEVSEGAVLRFYAGIGAGEVWLLDVGGVGEQWRFLAAGPPLVQIGRATDECEVGEIVLSPEALATVGADVTTAARGAGFGVLTSVPSVSPRTRAGPRRVDPGQLRWLPSYVVTAVLTGLEAGQAAWLAELRTASVLFVVVPSPEAYTEVGREQLTGTVRAAQEVVRALDGSFNQVVMDDQGLVILLAWGVPGHSHEDDARRALQAALEIRGRLRELALRPRVGVATGALFCGSYGNEIRQRYALVGAVVNRAARIAAVSPDSVHCDLTSRRAASERLDFDEAGSLPLKGIAEPVELFRPTGLSSRARAGRPGQGEMEMTGRDRERALLESALARAIQGAGPPLLLIEGEAGIGKSVLLGHLARDAQAAGLKPLIAAADAVERSTPYFPWRFPFRELLGLDPDRSRAAHRTRVTEIVATLAGHESRAPLLEPLLEVDFDDNETTAAMAGADRRVATRELLADLLDRLGGPTPVLILEDVHWFDSASFELIGVIRDRVPRALVAAAVRTTEGEAYTGLGAIAERPDTVRIPLVEMTGTEVLEMVRRSLRVAELPETLARILVERGEGHPLFTAELALLLWEMGVVRVSGDACSFDPEDERLSALQFSDKARGVVATRIDRLDPSHQLALKVAAVIGRTFAFRLVHDVHPIDEDRPVLRRLLAELIRPRLIDEERPDPALTYLFRHVVIREVAYGLVAFAQRRQLHARVAGSLEVSEEADRAESYPLLAHHWLMAEQYGPAIDYLERAGVEALRRGAGREALRFFGDALSLGEKHRAGLAGITDSRLAECERQMGEALEQLLDVPASSRYLETALSRLGYAVPGIAGKSRRPAFLQQAVIQLGHIVWPDALRRRPPPETARALEIAAKAYGSLAEHAYFESDVFGMVLFSLTSVNLAERACVPVAAERSYLALAHAAGLAGFAPLVRRYRARSANTKLGRNMALRETELGGRLLARGRPEEAEAAGRRAARLARKYADRHGEAQGWGCVTSSNILMGRPDEVIEAAGRIAATGRTDWALSAQCSAFLQSGRPAGMLERFAAIEEWEPAFALGHLVARVLHAEARGDRALAGSRADDALAIVEAPGAKNAFISAHLADLLGYYSRRYVQIDSADVEGRRGVIDRIRRLRAEFARYSRLIRIGRPRVERADALLAAHAGRRLRARRHIARGLRLAERMSMRPELVMLHLQAARCGLPDPEVHLERAASLCVAQGMDRLLAEVEGVRSVLATRVRDGR